MAVLWVAIEGQHMCLPLQPKAAFGLCADPKRRAIVMGAGLSRSRAEIIPPKQQRMRWSVLAIPHNAKACYPRLPSSWNGPLGIGENSLLLLSADGANILQSHFTYKSHLRDLVMAAVLHDVTFQNSVSHEGQNREFFNFRICSCTLNHSALKAAFEFKASMAGNWSLPPCTFLALFLFSFFVACCFGSNNNTTKGK